MDYCGKSLECVTLDGWAVYRNRSPQYNVGLPAAPAPPAPPM